MDQKPSLGVPAAARVVGGRYRLTALIGSGSMGEVFRAVALPSETPVAVKLLHRHLLTDGRATVRFRREAKIAAALQHPNWVKGIDVGQDADGVWFLAMELLEGRSLANLLRDEARLSFDRIYGLFRQILDALEAAHAGGLVHRDLKPGNVMVVTEPGGREVVKVCDLGIAKLAMDRCGGTEDTLRARATVDGAICGTPAYMSPEQARGQPVDARADLYAATVILFEMVTGRLPFTGPTKMDTLALHLTAVPPRMSRCRPDLPAGLEHVVWRGLAKTRESRYETAADLRRDLDAVFEGRWAPQADTLPPTDVPDASTVLEPPGTWPRVRRRGHWAVAGGVAVLAAIAAVVLPSVRPLHSEPQPSVTPAPLANPSRARPQPVDDAEWHRPATAPVLLAVVTPSVAEPPARAQSRPAHRQRPKDARPPRPVEPQPPASPVAITAPSIPTSAAATLTEAERMLVEGRSAEACLQGEQLLAATPDSPAVLRFLGRCYMRTRRRAAALASYRRYLELAPDAPDAALIRSIIE